MSKKTALTVASAVLGVVLAATTAIALNLGILSRTTPAADPIEATADLSAPTAAPIPPMPTPTARPFSPIPEGTRIITVYVDEPAPTVAAAPPTAPAPSRPTAAPAPSSPPAPSATPAPTAAPAPTATPSPQPTATPAPSSTPTPADPTTYPIYTVGGAGDVALVFDGSTIAFWGAYPNDGWQYNVEDSGPRKVKVKFRAGDDGDELEFQAELEGGRIKVEVGD